MRLKSFISLNIRKYNEVFNLGVRKFLFPKYKNFFWKNILFFRVNFYFLFFELKLKIVRLLRDERRWGNLAKSFSQKFQ